MKRYGLRIGATGIEFSTKDERDKALLSFTKGSTIKVNDSYGPLYNHEGTPEFGTYERESNETLCRCAKCEGTFSLDGCQKRDYPYEETWRTPHTWSTSDNYICDGCLAKANQDKELFDAKAKVAAAEVK